MSFRLLISFAKKISRREINRAIKEVVSNLSHKAMVLNIGSGGTIAEQIEGNLPDQTIKVTSTDIDPDRNPDVVDDLVNSNLPNHAYDCVICAEVIEHVVDPVKAVENLYRVLKPGGICLVTTPYMFPTHDAPHDYFRYTEFGLRLLFKEFQIVSIEGKTRWWETLLLQFWRMMWIGSTATKVAVWLVSIILLPIIPFLYLLSSANKNLAMTAGFVTVLRKPMK